MRWLKEYKDTISKGMTWLKANMHVGNMDIKTKVVTLMLIILPNDVDDDG